MTKTIELAGRTYSIKGELPNGAFYLEGPRGGSIVFAKPIADNLYTFNPAKACGSLKDARGFAITATREQLAA